MGLHWYTADKQRERNRDHTAIEMILVTLLIPHAALHFAIFTIALLFAAWFEKVPDIHYRFMYPDSMLLYSICTDWMSTAHFTTGYHLRTALKSGLTQGAKNVPRRCQCRYQ